MVIALIAAFSFYAPAHLARGVCSGNGRFRSYAIIMGSDGVVRIILCVALAVIGIEAAHVKWHMARGPSTTNNGLALCSLHHKLFDRGAFTLDTDRRVLLSQHARGGPSTRRWLTRGLPRKLCLRTFR